VGKLHELLAVEGSLRSSATNALGEGITTFTKRSEHFDGVLKTYSPMDEDGEQIPKDEKAIVTTVDDKLAFVAKQVSKSVDAIVSKEMTNSSGSAKSAVKIGNDEVELSATSLLALETQLMEIRAMYKAIPTLDPARVWKKDTGAGSGFMKTDPEVRFRVVKKQVPIELAPATKEHPAQVQLVVKEEQVGSYETIYNSARLTPGEKSERLGRIDSLIRAVKKARVKANQVIAQDVKIGSKIFNFINKG